MSCNMPSACSSCRSNSCVAPISSNWPAKSCTAYGQLGVDLPQHEREDLQAAAVAELYTRTLSNLTPRIVVNGSPQYLRNPRTVNWVRTLLFAGLRSAVLWRQLGGGRFKLLFGRRRLMEQAHELLAG